MPRRPLVVLLTLATATLVGAAPADAALCPAGQTGASFALTSGTGPLGAPDPRWVVTTPTGVPLVDLTTPAYHVAPAPGWVNPGSAGWISSTGAGTGVAGPATAVRRSYQTEFAMPPVGFKTLRVSYAADDDVTWHVNGQIVGSATAAAGSWHTLTVTTPFIRQGHNILEAWVTNRGGTEGLAVIGAAWFCA